MKRCENCGHPEIDHEGLRCLSRENGSYGCGCDGFQDPAEPEAFRTLAPVDEYTRELDELTLPLTVMKHRSVGLSTWMI